MIIYIYIYLKTSILYNRYIIIPLVYPLWSRADPKNRPATWQEVRPGALDVPGNEALEGAVVPGCKKCDLPSGYVEIAIENCHRNSGLPIKNGDFP